jgi:hypothetical protein
MECGPADFDGKKFFARKINKGKKLFNTFSDHRRFGFKGDQAIPAIAFGHFVSAIGASSGCRTGYHSLRIIVVTCVIVCIYIHFENPYFNIFKTALTGL